MFECLRLIQIVTVFELGDLADGQNVRFSRRAVRLRLHGHGRLRSRLAGVPPVLGSTRHACSDAP